MPKPLISIWTRTKDALQAAQSWAPYDPQHLVDLQGAIAKAQGHPKKISPSNARDILAIVSDPRAAKYFGPSKKRQEAALAGLRSILQPRANLAALISGPLRPKDSFIEKVGTPKTPEPTIVTDGGIRLRDYQVYYLAQVDTAMKAAAASDSHWNPLQPRDRGYLISPWQTGKSFLAGPVAERAKNHFPGKQVLFLSPLKVVTEQTISDLIGHYNGSISVFEGARKDLRGDIVVASVLSLKNSLSRLNPDNFGLVIVDESTFILAPSWRKTMRHLGFIDEDNELTHAPGKFALGISATGERGDGRHIREFFGDTLIAVRGFQWFIEHGYLHEVMGLEIPYGKSDADWEIIEEHDETVVAMRDTSRNRRKVVNTYRRNLELRKALIFVEKIKHAHNLADDFNAEYGPGYAAAVTGATADRDVDRILKAFNSGEGPKILISIRKLALGFRAHNTDGIVHGYQTSSPNLFAQRSSRPLGRQPGEPQRRILIITMEGRGMPLDRGQSAATLLGIYEEMPKSEVYIPREVRKERKAGSARFVGGSKKKSGSRGLLHFEKAEFRGLKVRAGAFGRAMRGILDARFDGDVMLMAERTRLRYAECDTYLHGYLPPTFRDVVALEARINLRHGTLAEPWLDDYMALLEAHHPLPQSPDPIIDNLIFAPKRELARLVRLAALRQATKDTLSSTVGSSRGNAGRYARLLKDFHAELPVKPEILKKVYDVIVGSEAATESEARAAIGRYVYALEKWEGRVIKKPFVDEKKKEEFDHRYMDFLDAVEELETGDSGDVVPFDDALSPDPLEMAEVDQKATTGLTIAPHDSHKVDPASVSLDPDIKLPHMASQIPSPEEMLLSVERERALRRLYSTLSFKEQVMLYLRLGVAPTPSEASEFSQVRVIPSDIKPNFEEEHSLEEVGEIFYVTRARADQVIAGGLSRLRSLKRLRMLEHVSDEARNVLERRRRELLESYEKEEQPSVEEARAATQKGERPEPEDDDPDDPGGKGGTPAPSGPAGSPAPTEEVPQGAKAGPAGTPQTFADVGAFSDDAPLWPEEDQATLPPAVLEGQVANPWTGIIVMTGGPMVWPQATGTIPMVIRAAAMPAGVPR